MTKDNKSLDQVYNIAINDTTSLNELYNMIAEILASRIDGLVIKEPIYRDFQEGDIRHSQGDVNKASKLLGYSPTHLIQEGLTETIEWFIKKQNI